jgi:hypothetical protein
LATGGSHDAFDMATAAQVARQEAKNKELWHLESNRSYRAGLRLRCTWRSPQRNFPKRFKPALTLLDVPGP